MHFCIIGDSWGNNDIIDNIFNEILIPKNHTFTNISYGGSSNQGQLRLLENQVLSPDCGVDCIIWFYTEPARDFTEFVSLDYGDDTSASKTVFSDLSYTNFYQDLNYIANQDFKHAQRLFEKYRIPFVVIGGAGVVDYDINNYDFPVWTLHSWNKELSKLNTMPVNCYTHHVVKMVDFGNYDKKSVLEEINRVEKLETIMSTNPDTYPDRYHPSRILYPELFERILANCYK